MKKSVCIFLVAIPRRKTAFLFILGYSCMVFDVIRQQNRIKRSYLVCFLVGSMRLHFSQNCHRDIGA